MLNTANFHNKNSRDNTLNSPYLSVIPTRRVNGKTCIAHTTIATLFDCNPALIAGSLNDFARKVGQHGTVVECDGIHYADSVAFRALATALAFGDYWDSECLRDVMRLLEVVV